MQGACCRLERAGGSAGLTHLKRMSGMGQVKSNEPMAPKIRTVPLSRVACLRFWGGGGRRGGFGCMRAHRARAAAAAADEPLACTSLPVASPPTHSSVPYAPLPPVSSLTRATTSSSLLTTTSSGGGGAGGRRQGQAVAGSSWRWAQAGRAAALLHQCAPHSPAPSCFRSSVWCAERMTLMVLMPCLGGLGPHRKGDSQTVGSPLSGGLASQKCSIPPSFACCSPPSTNPPSS